MIIRELSHTERESIRSMIISPNQDDFNLALALIGIPDRELQKCTKQQLSALKGLFSKRALSRVTTKEAKGRAYALRESILRWKRIKNAEIKKQKANFAKNKRNGTVKSGSV